MGENSVLSPLDEGLSGLLPSWNSYSTGLATVLLGIIAYRLATSQDPDVHPLLLAQQAEHNRIRMPGKSPIYSSRFSSELTTGLGVRDDDAGDPKRSLWARKHNGDLRDVWRQAFRGARPPRLAYGRAGQADDGSGKTGRLMSVFGRQVQEHSLADVNREIKAIGQYLSTKSASRAAIYLPNSIEFVSALFAASFQAVPTVLIPYEQTTDKLVSLLRQSEPDTIFALPGTVHLDDIVAAYPGLQRVVWIVDEGNKHLGWDETPEHLRGKIETTTWQLLVGAASGADSEAAPPVDRQTTPGGVVTFWREKDAQGEVTEKMVEYSQAQLAAAIGAQAEVLPGLGPDDVFLPADSLANAHTLVVTLTALFTNCSVVFNSAVCEDPDLSAVTSPFVICPTVLVATPTTLAKAHADYTEKLRGSLLARIRHWRRSRSLLFEGRMPSTVGSNLRLIITADHAGSGLDPALSPTVLSDLRASTGARVVYAMAVPQVAGAVAQTSAYDYRVPGGQTKAHFGAPLRCLRYVLHDVEGVANRDDKYQGEIFAMGPCVVGGEAGLGVTGTVRPDSTLSYL